MNTPPPLVGMTALVTASSRGIGFAIAKRFVEDGAQVCICARDPNSLRAAHEKLEALGAGRVISVAGDVADSAFLSSLQATVEGSFDASVDLLVCNSGGPPPGKALDHDEAAWRAALDGNLLSVVRLCRIFAPAMVEKRFGRIVSLTSTTAKEPAPSMALSNVTRAGVVAFTKTLASELGPHGITANSILTGAVDTERFASLINKGIATSGEAYDAVVQRIAKGIPVGYVSQPHELAGFVAYLCSRSASFINGAALPFDGGALKGLV